MLYRLPHRECELLLVLVNETGAQRVMKVLNSLVSPRGTLHSFGVFASNFLNLLRLLAAGLHVRHSKD